MPIRILITIILFSFFSCANKRAFELKEITDLSVELVLNETKNFSNNEINVLSSYSYLNKIIIGEWMIEEYENYIYEKYNISEYQCINDRISSVNTNDIIHIVDDFTSKNRRNDFNIILCPIYSNGEFTTMVAHYFKSKNIGYFFIDFEFEDDLNKWKVMRFEKRIGS